MGRDRLAALRAPAVTARIRNAHRAATRTRALSRRPLRVARAPVRGLRARADRLLETAGLHLSLPVGERAPPLLSDRPRALRPRRHAPPIDGTPERRRRPLGGKRRRASADRGGEPLPRRGPRMSVRVARELPGRWSCFWATSYSLELELFDEYLFRRLGEPPLNATLLVDFRRLATSLS